MRRKLAALFCIPLVVVLAACGGENMEYDDDNDGGGFSQECGEDDD